jgi:hypothetical protein
MVGAAWIVLVLLLALAARNNHRWAFWAGIVLYGADLVCTMVLLIAFTILALGVHAEEENVAVEQVTSVDEQQIDGADI